MAPATASRLANRGHRNPQRPPPGPALRERGTWRYLPHAILATLGTVVLPLALVELMEVLAGEQSALLSVGLAITLSALIATAGSWAWQRRPGGRDILFGDLMILGFVRRVRAERKLAETTKLLGADPLSAEGVADRVQILEQLARALDARDPFMVGHSLRVARNAEIVAARMGLRRRR